jgi:hypothetical protein
VAKEPADTAPSLATATTSSLTIRAPSTEKCSAESISLIRAWVSKAAMNFPNLAGHQALAVLE